MELRNLKTFIKVAKLNSFSQAAAQLGYAQSTVTAQIEALEQELGVQLFVRNGKRIRISSAGQDLLHYAHQFQTLDNETHGYFCGHKEPSGKLHLGILESISASAYMDGIENFLHHYPRVQLKVTIATTLQLMEMLKKGELDVIMLFDRPIMEPFFRTMYSKPMQVLFFAASNGQFDPNKPVNLDELLNQNWILTESGCNYRKVLEDKLAIRKEHISNQLEIGCTRSIINLVSKGLGISLLPDFNLLEDLNKGRICSILVQDFQVEMEMQILVSSEQWLSPAMKCLGDELCQILQE